MTGDSKISHGVEARGGCTGFVRRRVDGGKPEADERGCPTVMSVDARAPSEAACAAWWDGGKAGMIDMSSVAAVAVPRT